MDVVLKKYFWVVHLVVIALCAGLAGRAGAHLVEQNLLVDDSAQGSASHRFVPPGDRLHGKDTERIVARNVFCSACAPIVEEKKDEKPQSVEGGVKTQLPFELVSTMWVPPDANGAPSRWSMAVLRETGSKEKDVLLYNAGRELPNTQAKVLRVDPKRVYLSNNGVLEYFEMDGAEQKKPKEEPQAAAAPGASALDSAVAKGVRCNGAQCEVDRSVVDLALNNTAELATAARFVPSVKDGRPNGFKLYAIRPSSIFGKIGLQNGDTIKSINGMEMASPDQALGVYSKLRSASHLSVTVERRGETTTLDYTIR